MFNFKPYIFVFFIALVSCNEKNKNCEISDNEIEMRADILSQVTQTDSIPYLSSDSSNYASFYIVIVDTCYKYNALQKRMYTLSKKMNLEVDTMGRYYDESKGLICLPDTADDELYAGGYFPRRYPSQSLSIEYFDSYHSNMKNKQMALIAGVFQSKENADSLTKEIVTIEPNTFQIKATMYMGCMH